MLRQPGLEGEVQVNGRLAGVRPHPPAAEERPAGRQLGHPVGLGRQPVRVADEIKQVGGRVRADLEHHVRRVAEQPAAERPAADLAQLLEPVDRHVVEPAELAGPHVGAELLVDRGEQEIVPDGDGPPLLPGQLAQRPALVGRQGHRLFDEHVDAGPQDLLGRGGVVLRRQQDVDNVRLRLGEQGREVGERLRDAVAVGEAAGPAGVAVAGGDDPRAADAAQRLAVPVGDVAGAEDRDGKWHHLYSISRTGPRCRACFTIPTRCGNFDSVHAAAYAAASRAGTPRPRTYR
jgi:hypothetical protein